MNILLCLFLCLIWASPAALSRDSRIISFPDQNSAGKIYFLQPGWKCNSVTTEIDRKLPMLEARGRLNTPADRDLLLVGNFYLSEHMDLLSQLKADDLAALDLEKLVIDNRALKFITPLSGLKRLHLEATDISDAGLPALSKLTNLQYLSLAGTLITGRGIEHLAKLKQLKRLYLSHNAINEEHFSGISQLKSVRSLHLVGCSLTDKSLIPLSQLGQLRELNLTDNKYIDNKAMAALKKLKNLHWLTLGNTRVDFVGLKSLQGLPLKSLTADLRKLTVKQRRELQTIFPGTNLTDPSSKRLDATLFEPLH